MEFPQLDKLFDESLDRSDRRAPEINNPYGAAPLAADHFLLKKSWDYFKSRVKTIEDQWRKMLQAKEVQISTLNSELLAARERAVDLEDQNHLLRSLDQNIKKVRTEDHVGFSRKSENLKLHWEAERDALQRKIEDFEFRMERAKKESEARLLVVQSRENKLKDEVLFLKRDTAVQAERDHEFQRRWAEQITAQTEAIQSLENKVEILKNEIDRRDLYIKQFKETISTQEKDAHAMIQYVAELQRALKEKDSEMSHLKTRLDVLRQEKDTLRSAHEREQSEWRELWDRGREAWERKK